MTAPNAQNTTTAVAEQKPLSPIQTFRVLLDKMKPQIQMALPGHLDPARMMRIVLTTVQRTPNLLECTRDSLLGCILQCAQLGLEPDGLLGHAYLIPYKNNKKKRTECQLIVGYKGLLKLARQSGEVANIAARIVYEKDFFEYEYGLHEKLVHRPYVVKEEVIGPDGKPKEDTPGLPIFAYAIFWLRDGSASFEVMGYQDIERIRKASPSAESDAWMNHWPEMAKKTVLRKASKMSPASVEDRLAKAIALDERAEAGLPQEIDVLGGDGEAPAADDAPKAVMMSTLTQRKNIAGAIKRAKVQEADVLGWYKVASVDDLTHDQAHEAMERLAEVIGAEESSIS